MDGAKLTIRLSIFSKQSYSQSQVLITSTNTYSRVLPPNFTLLPTRNAFGCLGFTHNPFKFVPCEDPKSLRITTPPSSTRSSACNLDIDKCSKTISTGEVWPGFGWAPIKHLLSNANPLIRYCPITCPSFKIFNTTLYVASSVSLFTPLVR